MNILGLNGWNYRSHDASACIIKDNALIFAVEEEKITRKKHSFDAVPIQSALYALRYTNLTIDDIDIVAFGWDVTKLFKRKISKNEILNTLLPKSKFSYKKNPKLILVPHHLAHAYYSYYSSPFVNQKSAILIVDGQGESESTSMGYASKDGIFLDYSITSSQSLGYFYEAVCRFLGYLNLDGGKLMGLAGYGHHENIILSNKLNYHRKKLSGFPNIPVGEGFDTEEEVISWWMKYFEKVFHLEPRQINYRFSSSFKFEKDRGGNVENQYINIAHTAQYILEKIFLQMTEELKDTYQTDKLVLGGGVALNCSANEKIIDTNNIKLHIPSSPGDSGVSIGAAIYATMQYNKTQILGLDIPYLGPDYTNNEVKKILERNKISYQYIKKPDDVAVSLLKKNYLLGWFQNRAEFGPRALGNRSILANPLFKENKDRLNKLKGREQWRPLGVSIIEEEVKNYFETDNISPYMMIAAKVNKKLKKMCPNIVHIDGTSRPQLVKKESNPLFYSLIKKFGTLNGLPIIINTSFNRYDEPIVNSPEDALRTFFTTSLDALIINNYVIFKK